MHPIFARKGRLGLYLLSWVPLVPLVVLLLGRGGTQWEEALALGFPLVLVYAYVCLATWYVCRLVPLRPVKPLRLAGLQLLGALFSSGSWLILGWAWASLLANLPAFAGAEERYIGQVLQLFAVGVPLYLLAAAVHYLILALESSRDTERKAERRELELAIQTREAELRALKAQLDPHFLFNSLNTISALTGSDPAGARKMSILLSEFLRRSLRLGPREKISLAEELAHAASYLAVERVRFGERLRTEEEIEEGSRRFLVPSLILQPLVENAVRHGIAQLLEGGAIRLEARRLGQGERRRLVLAVENPCDADHPPVRGEGVGLANVAARLKTVYGAAARLEVTVPPGRFRVEIDVPAEEEKDAS